MMDQIRKLLDDYRRAGGACREVAIEGSGHVPFITHPAEFNRVFHEHLERTD
jgi:pimeloyl-ACP methyl ester carboxylesterase